MNANFIEQFRSIPSQEAVDKALAQANPKELTVRATNILITVGLSQKVRHTVGYQFWYSVVRVNLSDAYRPIKQRGHGKPLATVQEEIMKNLGGSVSYILNDRALENFASKHPNILSLEQRKELLKKRHFTEEERDALLTSVMSEEDSETSAMLVADLSKIFVKDPGHQGINKGKVSPLAIEKFKQLPKEFSGEGLVDYERQDEEEGGRIVSPSGLPTLHFEERQLKEDKIIKHTIVEPTWLSLYYDPALHAEEGVDITNEAALAGDKQAKVAEVTKILRNGLWLSPLASFAATSEELLDRDHVRGLFEKIVSGMTQFASQVAGLRKFAIMNDFDMSTTATAIVVPVGIDQLFDSEESAVSFLTAQSETQNEPELAAAATIKDSPMKKFSEKEIKILVEAANILDPVNPEIATVLDTILAQGAAGDELTISRADLAASLVRVANLLDEQGNTVAAAEADRLLNLLAPQSVDQFCSDGFSLLNRKLL